MLGAPVNFSALDLFPPDEGSINQYYGIIGSGKTYAATSDIFHDLEHGQVVYANWNVQWHGYDERNSKFLLFLAALGLKKNFYVFPKENFHFLDPRTLTTEKLAELNDCKIYLDEGHILFDSYELTKMSIQKRAMVLHTRHYDRSIIIISQRPTAIHVSLRANVNRFFKCECIMRAFGIVVFRKTEYQMLTNDERVDEEDEGDSQVYFGRKKIFEAYDTKYLRGDEPSSQENFASIWRVGVKDSWFALFKGTGERAPRAPRREESGDSDTGFWQKLRQDLRLNKKDDVE